MERGVDCRLGVARGALIFEELLENGHASPVPDEAIRRLAWIFWIEKQAKDSSPPDRLAIRHEQTRPHWDKLHAWLRTYP